MNTGAEEAAEAEVVLDWNWPLPIRVVDGIATGWPVTSLVCSLIFSFERPLAGRLGQRRAIRIEGKTNREAGLLLAAGHGHQPRGSSQSLPRT